MSKGNSGLFSGTSKNKTANFFEENAKLKVKRMISATHGGKNKSMAVGVYDAKTGTTKAAFAGPVPKRIHPILIERANRIGGIGSLGVSDKNTVGVCAEFHAVNKLLLSGSKISDIKLTRPIRPRTGKPMPFCDNCKAMFSDIIEKRGK